jgi:hypothetical protein
MTATVAELNGAYAGKPVWVILTGTSVRGFDFRRLVGEVTIACNDAALWMRPTLHLVNDRPLVKRYWDDSEWRKAVGRDSLWHPSYVDWSYADGQQVVCHKSCMIDYLGNPAAKRIHLYEYQTVGEPAIRLEDATLWCKNTVATAAIQLAWRIGASEVNLLGFDCYQRGKHGRYWWQQFEDDDRITRASSEGGYVRGMRLVRDWLAEVAPDLQVTNYSPLSTCDVWPKKDRKNDAHNDIHEGKRGVNVCA